MFSMKFSMKKKLDHWSFIPKINATVLKKIKDNKLDIIVWPTFLIIENYKKIILSPRKIEGCRREKFNPWGILS